MSEQTREELNEVAAAAGVEAPEQLPNKQAVFDAIAAIEAPPVPRVFKLRDPADGDESPVHRVSLGANPRVSLGAGETYSTVDRKLAKRLAANPHLEEVDPQ
jgi:hypothetical protein